MAWETDFIRLLDKPEPDKPLVFAIRRIVFPDWGSIQIILPNSGGIVDRSVKVQGYTLNTQNATTGGGGFELDLVAQSWVAGMRKGDVFELLACFKDPGAVFAWNTIDVGVLEDIEVTGTVAHLVFSGFQSVARSRRSNVVGEQTVYWSLFDGVSDVEFIDYDPGAFSPGAGEIEVSDLDLFERETTDDGLVRIQKDDLSWYYAIYTGTATSPDRLTGVSTTAVFDTTEDDVTGNRIHPVPYLYGHPIQIYRKSLTSTGTGLNGSADDYPESWGFAVPEDNVDWVDMELWTDASTDSFIYLWPDDGGSNDFRQFEIGGDWFAWYTERVRNLGFYPVLVEGLLSMRCLTSEEVIVETWGFEMTITDEDLLDGQDGITSHLWSPSHAAQFHRLALFGDSTDDFVESDIADVLPSARLGVTVTPYVRGPLEPDVLADAVERMKPWFVGTEEVALPQLLVLRGRSLKFAQLALGDKPLFSTLRIRSVEGSALTEQRPTVVGVIPDWSGGTCALMLACFPTPPPPDISYPTALIDAAVATGRLVGFWLANQGDETIVDGETIMEDISETSAVVVKAELATSGPWTRDTDAPPDFPGSISTTDRGTTMYMGFDGACAASRNAILFVKVATPQTSGQSTCLGGGAGGVASPTIDLDTFAYWDDTSLHTSGDGGGSGGGPAHADYAGWVVLVFQRTVGSNDGRIPCLYASTIGGTWRDIGREGGDIGYGSDWTGFHAFTATTRETGDGTVKHAGVMYLSGDIDEDDLHQLLIDGGIITA